MSANAAKKIKVSVTISEDILTAIDRYVHQHKELTRSSVINWWLRESSRREAMRKLERDTIDYYASLSEEQRDDDAAWAKFSSQHLSKLDID